MSGRSQAMLTRMRVVLGPGLLFSIFTVVAGCEGEVVGGAKPQPPAIVAPVVPKIPLLSLVRAAPSPMRALSNREYLYSVSDLIGVELPLAVTAPWAPTTKYSGFDSIGWTNFDTKLVRDRLATIEVILNEALKSPKIMTCAATTLSQVEYSFCAQIIIERTAERAFRRPLSPEELGELKNAYINGIVIGQPTIADSNLLMKEGLHSALAAVLLSPQFLVKTELEPTPGFVGERELSSYELASRLSYFITSSLPDDQLWAAAKRGELASADELQRHAERLLNNHVDRFVDNFMGQWFGFRELDTATDTLEQAMLQETRRTLREVVSNDLPTTAVLRPNFTYLNRDLATHYGIAGDFSTTFTRVPMTERGGILSQASILKLTSSSAETSPVRRGAWVQGRLMCKTIPPPPPELREQISAASAAIPANATVKQRLSMHKNAGAACAGCHQFMDPIGIGLEGFDARGKKRTVYADGRPVETDSEFFGSPFTNFEGLNALLFAMPDVQRCAAEKIAVHSLGRVIKPTGQDADLVKYLSTPDEGTTPVTFKQIVVRMVRSPAFRKVVHAP